MEQSLYEKEREERSKTREMSPEVTGKWKTKVIWITVLGLIILAIGWWLKSLAPEGADFSQSYPDQGREHIAVDSSHEPYNSNPPTSGGHYAEWAAEKFYTREVPDENLVHNLEHGDVWIAYHPRISDEAKNRLKKFANSKVVITPRKANKRDIALMAWTRLDAFDLENGVLDTRRISDFIKRYKDRGPERVMSGVGGKEF